MPEISSCVIPDFLQRTVAFHFHNYFMLQNREIGWDSVGCPTTILRCFIFLRWCAIYTTPQARIPPSQFGDKLFCALILSLNTKRKLLQTSALKNINKTSWNVAYSCKKRKKQNVWKHIFIFVLQRAYPYLKEMLIRGTTVHAMKCCEVCISPCKNPDKVLKFCLESSIMISMF